MILNVSSAVKNLKPSIGPDNIHANHVKYGPKDLIVFISKFFSSSYRHSYVNKDLVTGVVLPLVKDQFGNKESSNNYRPIISSSVLLKILELALKVKVEKLLITNERQFAYKKHASTHVAYLMFKEVVLSHIKTKNSVHACFLDLTKAFDKVNHYKLFRSLESNGFSCDFILFIQDW